MATAQVVGSSHANVDARAKATGRATYGADEFPRRLLFGKVLRSNVPHARIRKIDCRAARSLPGVRAVLTGADTPGTRYGQQHKDQFLLATDKVRFIGDEVAVIIATDETVAEEAIGLIQVDYEELPAVFDSRDALLPGAPRIHEDKGNVADRIHLTHGDPIEAFRSCDFVFENEYSTHSCHHGYLEPNVCTAAMDDHGRLTLWVPAQKPFQLRVWVAEALGIPPSRLRVVQTTVGGAFGGKSIQPIYALAAFAALKTGAAVRIANTRAEEFYASTPCVPATIRVETGVMNDGTLTARRMTILADNGAYTYNGAGCLSVMALRADGQYRVRNLEVEATLAYTNKVPTSAYRGFGSPQVNFAIESQLDEIARALGLDPLDLRLKNIVASGDVSIRGYRITSCGIGECLKRAAEEVGWEAHRKVGASRRAPGKVHGVGLACCLHVSGSAATFPGYEGSSALVRMDGQGQVGVLTGEVDLGQGSKTIFAQIVAQVLGVSTDRIVVNDVDTDASPFGLGTFASRVTMMGGNAVRMAAEEVRRQLLEAASELMEARLSDLAIEDGAILVAGSSGAKLPVEDVARRLVYKHAGQPVTGIGNFKPDSVVFPDRVTKYGNVSVAYNYAAHAAEVEVDLETGEVTVLKIAAAHDLGKALNPMAAQGQIQGGVVQALGYTLSEQLQTENGRVLNLDFKDYKMPTAPDLPVVRAILVETDEPDGPFGAKGVGEATSIPTLGAIANAIYHATGVQPTCLPLTSEHMHSVLRTRSAFADDVAVDCRE
ncbi:MAG: molybdopterin-dependent oxidoreductase [Chloroflexi bacterium]|nr:molybdopterin-dependent oxidoreductase [Chloroflexota bacterium]